MNCERFPEKFPRDFSLTLSFRWTMALTIDRRPINRCCSRPRRATSRHRGRGWTRWPPMASRTGGVSSECISRALTSPHLHLASCLPSERQKPSVKVCWSAGSLFSTFFDPPTFFFPCQFPEPCHARAPRAAPMGGRGGRATRGNRPNRQR